METVKVAPVSLWKHIKRRRTVQSICCNFIGIAIIVCIHFHYKGWQFYWPTFLSCFYLAFLERSVLSPLLRPYQALFSEEGIEFWFQQFGFKWRRYQTYDRLMIHLVHHCKGINYVQILWKRFPFRVYVLAEENNWGEESQQVFIEYARKHPVQVLFNQRPINDNDIKDVYGSP